MSDYVIILRFSAFNATHTYICAGHSFDAALLCLLLCEKGGNTDSHTLGHSHTHWGAQAVSGSGGQSCAGGRGSICDVTGF